MSTTAERAIALRMAKELLEELADAGRPYGQRADLRERAQMILRHLPGPDDVLDVLTVLSTAAENSSAWSDVRDFVTVDAASCEIDRKLLECFDELLVALRDVPAERERTKLIGRFVADENLRWKKVELAFLRARYGVGAEELEIRIREAPDAGAATLLDLMRIGSEEDVRKSAPGQAADLKRALAAGLFGFLSFVSGAVAVLGMSLGSPLGQDIFAGILCFVCLGVLVRLLAPLFPRRPARS